MAQALNHYALRALVASTLITLALSAAGAYGQSITIYAVLRPLLGPQLL